METKEGKSSAKDQPATGEKTAGAAAAQPARNERPSLPEQIGSEAAKHFEEMAGEAFDMTAPGQIARGIGVIEQLVEAGSSDKPGTPAAKVAAEAKTIFAEKAPGAAMVETFVDESIKGASTGDAARAAIETGLPHAPFARVEASLERADAKIQGGDYVGGVSEGVRAARQFQSEVRDITMAFAAVTEGGGGRAKSSQTGEGTPETKAIPAPESALEAPKADAALAEPSKPAAEAPSAAADPPKPEAAAEPADATLGATPVEGVAVETPPPDPESAPKAARASEAPAVSEGPKAEALAPDAPVREPPETPGNAAAAPEVAETPNGDALTPESAAPESPESGPNAEPDPPDDHDTRGEERGREILEEFGEAQERFGRDQAEPSGEVGADDWSEPGRIPELDEGYDPNWEPEGPHRFPGESKGTWIEGGRGDGRWQPHEPGAFGLEPGQSITFQEGTPDLADHAVQTPSGRPGVFEVNGLDGGPGDYAKAVQKLAAQEGMTARQAQQWLRDNSLRIHHYGGRMMQVVPERLHSGLAHQGSASELRK
jgi:hypothetical protein